MKDYLIHASAKYGFEVDEVITASNLRMAWRIFKIRNEVYFEGLRFMNAFCNGRIFIKIN